MPNLIVGLGLAVFGCINDAGALSSITQNCWTPPVGCTTADGTSCNANLCNTCKVSSEVNETTGIEVLLNKTVKTTCTSGGFYSCTCINGATGYKCAAGYYGTANSTGTGGCIKCPANATCAGGNESTFSCNSWYYKIGSSCKECPANSVACSSDGTNIDIRCAKGYYLKIVGNNYSCNRCPAIIDKDTGHKVYMDSRLTVAAYGTSAVGFDDAMFCYWGSGTYYDESGTIDIGDTANVKQCGYDSTIVPVD